MVDKKPTKKKAKKKTKKKAVKTVEKSEPKAEPVLDIRINSEFLKEVVLMKEAFKLADEATVVFRGLALLREIIRRKELGYDLCFVERKTKKMVAVSFGEKKDAGGS